MKNAFASLVTIMILTAMIITGGAMAAPAPEDAGDPEEPVLVGSGKEREFVYTKDVPAYTSGLLPR